MDKLRQMYDQAHPRDPLVDAPLGGSGDARASLIDRMRDGLPPDVFLANGGWDLDRWVLYNGTNDTQNKVEQLDDLARAEGWDNVMPQLVRDTVTVGAHVYAVPLDVHRLNLLFYNKRLFAQAGVAPPTEATTVDELFGMLDALKAAGVTPLALSTKTSPWPLSLLLFENLLVARAGAEAYQSFFCGHGDPLGAPITQAVQDLGRLLSSSYTNTDRSQLAWDESLSLVRDQKAAVTVMGDWARGYFLATAAATGASPDDIGEVAMPGTGGVFIFTTDTFALPRGALNPDGARDLMRLAGSRAGQDSFNPTKGATSPRTDSDANAYDAQAQQTRAEFWAVADDPNRLVPSTAMLARQEFMDEINDVLGDFADSTDPDVVGNDSKVLYTIRNFYDILVSSPAPTLCP
jgi:glucose/mannose transport system substrate-binding protein